MSSHGGLSDRDMVIHIFYQETREFYDLERLWGDASSIIFDSV